jgi:receptor expression-enhancing protein 1/2/3/4
LNKTPASGQGPPTSGLASGLSLESVMGLWKSYAPSVMSALQPAGQPNVRVTTPTPTSTSATSYNTPSVERRTPQPYNTDSGYFNPNPESNGSQY